MERPLDEGFDDSQDRFNLGAMLLIALAGVLGTTLAVWAIHFLSPAAVQAVAAGRALPRVAVLPFRSLSKAPEDMQADLQLTALVIAGLSQISEVQTLPPETDADPKAIGKDLRVRVLLMGKIERQPNEVRVNVQLISTHDGRQIWAHVFTGEASDYRGLSAQIGRSIAPYLTALLD